MNDAATTAAAVLRLRGLERRFKSGDSELLVLDGVDLDIRPGEIVGLVGPSGSGKSSLLHAAGLLERPSGGDVEIEGRSAWDLNDDARTAIRRTRIGFVYQFHHLLAEFDALLNAALPAIIAGVSKKRATAESERLLGLMGLSGRIHHQPAQLSGGEQQRVAIARAMVNKPALILADEPTGNLDSHSGADVMALLHELNAAGRTIVLITHDPGVAAAATRQVHLRDGQVVS